jgi:hypothetical protein
MAFYHLAGQEFTFPCPVPELEPFEITGSEQRTAEEAVPFFPQSALQNGSSPSASLTSQTVGWVGGAQRLVEVVETSRGILMKVEGGGEFFITPGGETIGKLDPPQELSQLDRQIIAGPALVLALALRRVWSLHASAALFKNILFVFLGESGQGKSTLVAYLSQSEAWRLVADDILPVTADSAGEWAWPHFPQLKLSPASQPGVRMPEKLPLGKICLLTPAGKDDIPAVQLLPPGEAVKVLLAHTAGARLFDPGLLAKHLEFCGRIASQVPVHQLNYPHGRQMLPKVKELLETYVDS